MRLLQKIEELQIEESTLIVFSSDNGPHLEGGADPQFFNSQGIYRGYKRSLYEGGIRVPMIASWKGKITPNQTTRHISAFWDVMPTFLEIANTTVQSNMDGISFLPTLLNKEQPKHEFLYWEFHTEYGIPAQAILLKEQWKALRFVRDKSFTPIEIYDLKTDPSEKDDIAHKHPEIVKQILEILNKEHADSPVEDWNFKIAKSQS